MKRTRIRPRSQRRVDEADQRAAAVAEAFAPHRGRCALEPVGGCWGPIDPHEVIRRGQRPGSHLDARLILPLCRRHHDLDVELSTAEELGIRAPGWTAERYGVERVVAELDRIRREYLLTGARGSPFWRD